VADALSLGHDQTAETIGVDLTDNSMDAEPVQATQQDSGGKRSSEIAEPEQAGPEVHSEGSPEQAPHADNWSRLFDCIESWHLYRPEEMKAVLSLGADTSHGSRTLLFGNGVASKAPALAPNNGIVSNALSVSGNQLYHTTALLMLQKKPQGSRLVVVYFLMVIELTRYTLQRSIHWHAR
jgi:hypothetical protein